MRCLGPSCLPDSVSPAQDCWKNHTDTSLVQMSLRVSLLGCMMVSAKGPLPVSSIQAHITGPRADKGERGNMVFHLTGMVHDLFLFFI